MLPPSIIHEDDAIIAVAKPAGIATANVPAGEESVFTLVRGLLAGRDRGRREPPFLGVVSRLDRPVSGVVVFAKTPPAAADLAKQFRDRSVDKVYVAVVEGRFPAALNAWVEWIDVLARPRRGPTRRVSGETGDEAGAEAGEARIRARVLVRHGEVSLVELRPETGRRHQIRAQLGARGCPVVGDRLYGARLPLPGGIALHAWRLTISHPATRQRTVLTAEPPVPWRPRFAALVSHLPPPGEVDSRSPRAGPPAQDESR
ncbi:MAG: RluA family pseudouridine synthase [Planctomycetaceae bacterium]